MSRYIVWIEIDDDEVRGVRPVERDEDVADVAGRRQQDRAGLDAEALGAQPHLVDCLLAGDVHRRCPPGSRRNRRGHLQQQRRFADPRVAADQDYRSWHKSAAAHPVEFGDPGPPPRR